MLEGVQKFIFNDARINSWTLRRRIRNDEDLSATEDISSWGKMLLRKNPKLVRDLEQRYSTQSDKIIAAILPAHDVIVAAMNDEMKVMKIKLSCTKYAAKKLVGTNYESYRGYMIIECENIVADELIEFAQNPNNRHSTFRFGDDLPDPRKYIALDLQDFLLTTSHVISPRVTFPIRDDKVVFNETISS